MPTYLDILQPLDQETLSREAKSEKISALTFDANTEGVMAGLILDGETVSKLSIKEGYLQSANFVTGSTGWRIDSDGDLEANTGTFRGALSGNSLEIGSGADTWHVDTSGNMWWGSSTTYANASTRMSAGGDLAVTSGSFTTITSNVVRTAASGPRTVMGDSLNALDLYSSSEYKSSVVGTNSALQLSMEEAGGYVSIYAVTDADSTLEIARFDGDAGITIENSMLLTAYRLYINKLGATVGIPLDIDNAGTSTSLDIDQTYSSSTANAVTIDNAGTGKGLQITLTNASAGTAINIVNAGANESIAMSQSNASNSATGVSLSSAGTGKGISVSLTNESSTNTGLYVDHAGEANVAQFASVDNASRTNAVVSIVANSARGAHLNLNPIATAPYAPSEGDIYMDTDHHLYMNTGTVWVRLDNDHP